MPTGRFIIEVPIIIPGKTSKIIHRPKLIRAEDDVRKILEIVLRDRSSKVRVFELSRLFIVCYNTKDMSEKAPKKKRKNKNPIDSKKTERDG